MYLKTNFMTIFSEKYEHVTVKMETLSSQQPAMLIMLSLNWIFLEETWSTCSPSRFWARLSVWSEGTVFRAATSCFKLSSLSLHFSRRRQSFNRSSDRRKRKHWFRASSLIKWCWWIRCSQRWCICFMLNNKWYMCFDQMSTIRQNGTVSWTQTHKP